MSLITDDPGESPRDCATKQHHHGIRSIRRRRRVLMAVSSATASLVSLSIILWLTLLRPSAPAFSLLAATVNASNATLVVVVDAALVAHNPNARAAALYDRLQLRVLGPGAAPSPIPPFQQPQGDVVLSASASVQAPAAMDRQLLRLRVEGQLRWKVAAWVSASHAITADCVALVPPQLRLRAVVVLQLQGSHCPTTLA